MLTNPRFGVALDVVVFLGVQKSSEERGYDVTCDEYLASEEREQFTDDLLRQLCDGSQADSLSSVEGQRQDPEVVVALRAILTMYQEIRHRDVAQRSGPAEVAMAVE